MHHLLCVLLHFVAFLCIFWNEPINEMPQCQFPIFCYFCVLEKLHEKYSQNWTKQKPKFLFPDTRRIPKQRRRGARGRPCHAVVQATPRLCQAMGWAPSPSPDIALPPIYSPRRENPKAQTLFQKTYCKPPPSSTRDREGPEALPGTLPERESPPKAFFITMPTSGVICE
jgi:hypothetical protein